MDWYTQDRLGDLTIHFLPANHGSGRSLHESDQTLWGGWLFDWNGYRNYNPIHAHHQFHPAYRKI
jgi:L-ascorbate metabolism protein UlaG (beta-lactamase superfamily)